MKSNIYTVKRLRLLTYLVNKGFTEYTVIPDPTALKGDFKWFVFERTPELEEALTEYFSQFN
jgi:hypothetical protein